MYNVYKSVVNYAEYHGTQIEYGLFKLKGNVEALLNETEFQHNYKMNNFVIVKLIKKDYTFYVIFCSSKMFSNIKYEESIRSIINNYEHSTLFVTEPLSTDVKLMNIINNNMPRVNFMYAASFISNPLGHITSPLGIKKIDYEPIKKITLINETDLPVIPFTDPVIAWMQYKPGDIIEEQQRSTVCGIETIHRRVI